MIINNRKGKLIECDSCGVTMEADSFDDALMIIKEEKWQTAKTENGYEHYCTDCKE